MESFRIDLHIHSCLSPCAELDMTPLRIIRRAKELGLDMIALSDHNSARNAWVAVELGQEHGINVLPAMEVTSREEAHVLAVFETVESAEAMQDALYAELPGDIDGRKEWQVLVNHADEVLGFENKMLLGASSRPLKELVDAIRSFGGLAIASHVDRGAFSVMSQMGFVPDDVIFDAFEVLDSDKARAGLMFHPHVPWVSHSDAHRPEDLGRRYTVLTAEAPEFGELALALKGEGGRSVRPEPMGLLGQGR